MNRHTVIIPTLALGERAEMLKRAIHSAREGNRTPISVIVVVNGQRFDAALVAWLMQADAVRVVHLETPGSPGAILAGRLAVDTESFSYLDDDDEYLPGAVDARLAPFAGSEDVDIVVSNGFRRQGAAQELALSNLANVSADPLAALFKENWLPSCAAAFRFLCAPVR